MAKLTRWEAARCLAWRASANTAMALFAWPFYAIDIVFEKLAAIVTILCATAAAPAILFYDWCVERHNAIHAAPAGRAALTEGKDE